MSRMLQDPPQVRLPRRFLEVPDRSQQPPEPPFLQAWPENVPEESGFFHRLASALDALTRFLAACPGCGASDGVTIIVEVAPAWWLPVERHWCHGCGYRWARSSALFGEAFW